MSLSEEFTMAGGLEPSANPFDVQPGAIPPAFGGRTVELAQMRAAVARITAGGTGPVEVIEALRGYGKTALLSHAVRQLVTDSADALPGSFHAHGSLVDLIDGADALGHALRRLHKRARGDLSTLLRQTTRAKVGPLEGERHVPTDSVAGIALLTAELATTAAAQRVPILLAVDEAHDAPEVAVQVLRGLQWAGPSPVSCYFAGLPGTRDAMADVLTSAERLQVQTLELLGPDAVWDALVPPCRERTVDVNQEVVDAVATASGGYPYFVALWGHHLWLLAPGDNIDGDAIEPARTAVQHAADSLYRGRWHRMTPSEQRYATALASLGNQAPTSDIARTMSRSPQSLTRVRAALIDSGMLYAPRHGHAAFTVPGFATWVRNQPTD